MEVKLIRKPDFEKYIKQYDNDMLLERIVARSDDLNRFAFVTEEDLISMMAFSENKTAVKIYNVWTNPKHRRQGYMSKLWDHMFTVIREEHPNWSVIYNEAFTYFSAPFFIKEGFTILDRNEVFYDLELKREDYETNRSY